MYFKLLAIVENDFNIKNVSNFFKYNQVNIHNVLTSVDPSIVTQKMLFTLINEGILNIDENDKAYKDKLTFRHYMNSIDDSSLVYILNRLQNDNDEYKQDEKKISYIQTLDTPSKLYTYILFNPSDIYLSVSWVPWSAFNTTKLIGYIQDGVINPFKKQPEFNGSDVKNINFKTHLELCIEEIPLTSKEDIDLYNGIIELLCYIEDLQTW
jgi:hypothetical protein